MHRHGGCRCARGDCDDGCTDDDDGERDADFSYAYDECEDDDGADYHYYASYYDNDDGGGHDNGRDGVDCTDHDSHCIGWDNDDYYLDDDYYYDDD